MLSLLALVAGLLVGYLASNLVYYDWTREGMIYTQKWGFILLATFVGFAILRYFFDSKSRAEKLSEERFNHRKHELIEWAKTLKAKQEGLLDLHSRHTELNHRIEVDAAVVHQRKRQLGTKLRQVDEFLAEMEKLKTSLEQGASRDGRKRREQGRMGKIQERAEALKKEIENE